MRNYHTDYICGDISAGVHVQVAPVSADMSEYVGVDIDANDDVYMNHNWQPHI